MGLQQTQPVVVQLSSRPREGGIQSEKRQRQTHTHADWEQVRGGAGMVMWVFGYGSLVWNPGFAYDARLVGFVRDYRRVFYQGGYH